MFFSIIILGLLFTDVPKKISELGRTDRVFLNVSKRGGVVNQLKQDLN